MRNIIFKTKGFTIIEMMVTLSIVTLLTVMVLAYSRQSEKVTNLIRDSDKLIFELRRAQNLAMLTLQPTTTNGAASASATPICGWGIYIDKDNMPQTQYILFSDFCNTGIRNQYDPGEEAETINLLKGVQIFKSNVYSVVFVPPEPHVVFTPNPPLEIEPDDEEENDTSALIRLDLVTQPKTGKKEYYRIRVTQAGQISKELKP